MGLRLEPPRTVGLHEAREQRVGEQRHVAEEIVEHVGLDDVLELAFLAQPDRYREAPLRELLLRVLEEYRRLAGRFSAEKFEAGAICDLAVRAGMRRLLDRDGGGSAKAALIVTHTGHILREVPAVGHPAHDLAPEPVVIQILNASAPARAELVERTPRPASATPSV